MSVDTYMNIQLGNTEEVLYSFISLAPPVIFSTLPIEFKTKQVISFLVVELS